MTTGLQRFYGGHDLHFITCSCYRRQPELGSARRRDLFLQVLEQARQRYQFVVYGYVIMPEHFHLLISEPSKGDPSVIMKVVKQRFARLLNRRRKRATAQGVLWNYAPTPVWQKRFYDFNVRHAAQVKVAHPVMLHAIALAKKRMIAWMPSRLPTACAVTCRRKDSVACACAG